MGSSSTSFGKGRIPITSIMADRQLDAIYEYLSAIPGIDNATSTPPAGAPDDLLNDCGDPSSSKAAAASAPGNARTSARK